MCACVYFRREHILVMLKYLLVTFAIDRALLIALHSFLLIDAQPFSFHSHTDICRNAHRWRVSEVLQRTKDTFSHKAGAL